jgi:tryptophan 2,3-dioxygenase
LEEQQMTLSYEEYLAVPGLLAAMQPEQKTLDEHQLVAFWAHSLLYGDVARRELQGLSALLAAPLSRARYDDAEKRVRRCLVLYRLILEAEEVVRHVMFQHQPHAIRFRLASSDPRQVGGWSELTPLVRCLLEYLPLLRLEAGVPDAARLVNQLQAQVARLGALAEQVERRPAASSRALPTLEVNG